MENSKDQIEISYDRARRITSKRKTTGSGNNSKNSGMKRDQSDNTGARKRKYNSNFETIKESQYRDVSDDRSYGPIGRADKNKDNSGFTKFKHNGRKPSQIGGGRGRDGSATERLDVSQYSNSNSILISSNQYVNQEIRSPDDKYENKSDNEAALLRGRQKEIVPRFAQSTNTLSHSPATNEKEGGEQSSLN